VNLDARHRPRSLDRPFNWRAELRELANGCAWIGGILLVWWVAALVVS
jgi:hypothetical protein